MTKKILIAVMLMCSAVFLSDAKVDLPSVFGNNMVLQRNTSVAFWGTAKANAKVSIKPSWTKGKTIVESDAAGKWFAKVATPEAGGPYTVTISDGEKLVLDNV